MSIISVKSIFLVTSLSILRAARIVLRIKLLMMFNLLNERSADATVTGRITEDSQGYAHVLKYLNKVKSSHCYRLKEFLTKLISDKFARVVSRLLNACYR